MAAVFMNKFPGDSFLHNLLHLLSGMADAGYSRNIHLKTDRESIKPLQKTLSGGGGGGCLVKVRKSLKKKEKRLSRASACENGG